MADKYTLYALAWIFPLAAFFTVLVFVLWKNRQIKRLRAELTDQEKLQKNEERIGFMNTLLAGVTDAIITFDKDMMIQSWNRGAEKIYGWKAEEVIGKFGGGSLRVGFPGGPETTVFHNLNQTGAWEGEVIHKRKDGSTAYLLSSTTQIRDKQGKVLGIISINKDITDVVLAEKMRNAVYRISELAQSASDPGEMYRQIHGVIGELMDVPNLFIVLPAAGGPPLVAYFAEEKESATGPGSPVNGFAGFVIRSGNPVLIRHDEEQWIDGFPTAETFPPPDVDWLGVPLSIEKETIGAVVVRSGARNLRFGEREKKILTFISEQIALSVQRRKIRQELIEAKEKAEVSSRLTSALLSNMNHELRTPMNGILGFAEILINELSDPESRIKAENILTSGRRLMNTLDAIMDLSYLESDKVSRKFRPVPVAPVVRNVLRNYEEAIKRKHLKVDISVAGNIAILGDEHLFHHLIRILTDNAVKYTERGSVSITALPDQKEDRQVISISVKDTGIGIAPEYHPIIFEAFRQVSEGYARHFEGSGLGLTIARKIIELMQGSIRLTSATGQGSEFTVILPAASHTPAMGYTEEPVRETLAGKSPAPRKKLPDVLIVEDNLVNIQLLMIYIRRYCNIFTTLDARSAIEVTGQRKFDAILMDINLGPGMDGTQAMLEIRKQAGYEEVPILAVTGYASIGDRERFMNLGFSGYIPKPFDKETIATVMKGLFP